MCTGGSQKCIDGSHGVKYSPIPFYIFTQGDLAKLIWQHPNFLQIHVGSACLNLVFMMGVGILAIALVAVKRHFWRAE